jgi:hypothetical protein
MVALFASSEARCLQLLDDMQRTFHILERLPALEELDLRLDSMEVMRPNDVSPWYTDSYRGKREFRKYMEESITEGRRREYFDSRIMMALQGAKWLPTKVTVGIRWTPIGGEGVGTDEEIAETRKVFLHQIREEIAPTRIICKGVM